MKMYKLGILGYNYGSWTFITSIKNCYNIGKVSCDWTSDYDATKEYGSALGADYCAGGIVGHAGSTVRVDGCWNGGEVIGEHFVGGVAGRVNDDSKDAIINCYNVGTISAVQYAGGIMGKDVYKMGMKHSYNMGVVAEGMYCGSLAGSIYDGEESFEDCYYLDSTGPATPAGIDYTGVTPLTAEEMANPESFVGFDFVDTWKLREDNTQPLLKW